MNTESNNLSKHFESFLPETEPGEMDSVWRQVEPHLPVRKRRPLFWIPMTAGFVAVLLFVTVLWQPGVEGNKEQQLLTITPAEIKAAQNTRPSTAERQPEKTGGSKNAQPARAASTVPAETKDIASKKSSSPPQKSEAASARASGLNSGRQKYFSATSGSESVAADHLSLEPTDVSPDTLSLLSEEPHLNTELLVPHSLSLPLTSVERSISPATAAIPRPQLWTSKASVIIFGGAGTRNTLYSSQSKHLQPGWNAGVSFNRVVGKKWMLHATAQLGGLFGSYSETTEYYETVYPPVQSAVSGTFQSAAAVRYREVTDVNTVTAKKGYLLSAGAGCCLWSGYRMNVNFLASFGIQKVGYSNSLRRTYGADTLKIPPSRQPVPPPPSYATAFSSAAASDTKNQSSYRQYFVAPQVDVFYRLSHRFALVSRLTFVSPVSFGGNIKRASDATLSSFGPLVSGAFYPVRSSDLMLNFGVSCKL